MKGSINRIIFFNELPLTDRLYKICGVDTLIKNGFSVEIWNISIFLYEDLFRTEEEPLCEQGGHFKHCIFSTKKEIIAALSNVNSSDFIIVTIGYYLFRYFKKGINERVLAGKKLR